MNQQKLPILIAIDFDETIVYSHPFPTIKRIKKGAKKYINKLYHQGYHITIWTCRTDKDECKDATNAALFLIENGINFHLINNCHPALIKAFGNNTRKIAVDMYIDDKNLWLFGIPSWFWLYRLIKFKSFFLKEGRKILSHCKPEHFIV